MPAGGRRKGDKMDTLCGIFIVICGLIIVAAVLMGFTWFFGSAIGLTDWNKDNRDDPPPPPPWGFN